MEKQWGAGTPAPFLSRPRPPWRLPAVSLPGCIASGSAMQHLLTLQLESQSLSLGLMGQSHAPGWVLLSVQGPLLPGQRVSLWEHAFPLTQPPAAGTPASSSTAWRQLQLLPAQGPLMPHRQWQDPTQGVWEPLALSPSIEGGGEALAQMQRILEPEKPEPLPLLEMQLPCSP